MTMAACLQSPTYSTGAFVKRFIETDVSRAAQKPARRFIKRLLPGGQIFCRTHAGLPEMSICCALGPGLCTAATRI
jgi:hypothetical protein